MPFDTMGLWKSGLGYPKILHPGPVKVNIFMYTRNSSRMKKGSQIFMITLKSEREIEAMDRAGSIIAMIFEELRDVVKPGITTGEIDQYVERRIREEGAIPEEVGFEGYPYATCTSTNDEICHGFPDRKRVLKAGDICSVDTVLSIDGFFTDSCTTFAVGEIDPETQRLLDVTKKAMYLGIEQCVAGNRIGDIGAAIQEYVEAEGFSVVREFVGHGIQPTMHEEPAVPHYGTAGRGLRLKNGMTLTVEPMVNVGAWKSKMDDNGWTARTIDGSLSAQYEHTLAITPDGPKILTMQSPVPGEDALGLDQLKINYNYPQSN